MQDIIDAIQGSLELTSGCTEPAATAYCASFAGRYLLEEPINLSLWIDQLNSKEFYGFRPGRPSRQQFYRDAGQPVEI